MKIILLGAPGSGKGTQATFICEKFKLPHISTGDIFRENIKNETPLGLQIKSIIDSGRFCPDEMTIEIVKDRLSQPDCKKGYLLDGFPRTLVQAEALNNFSAPDVVLNLSMDDEMIIQRISGRRVCRSCGSTFNTEFIGNNMVCGKCGGELYIRKDDNPEAIAERLKVYEEQTKPLIDYYKEKNILVEINSGRFYKEVQEDIEKVLTK
ncbi:MAG: adenylate kinase [Clostridia bacterium]|nr:adenylate kinase [Clostridia bacterium]